MGTRKVTTLQLVDSVKAATVRGKRRRVDQIPPLTRKKMPEQFEIRGPGSAGELAEVEESQWSAVMEILVHHIYRDVRQLKSALYMKGAESPQRKQPGRASSGLQIVPKEAA